MDDLLLIKARDGKFVKFLSQDKAQVFGAFGELICKDVDVIYSEISAFKAWDMLKKQKSFIINLEFNPKGKPFIFIGPYGLKGGGVGGSSERWRQSKDRVINQPNETYRALNPEQRELQHDISDNLELLKDGAKRGIVENITSSIKALGYISLGDHESPHVSSKTLLECLKEENIWEHDEWILIRREIARMARALLFSGYHMSKNRVSFFKSNRDDFLHIAESIENRILNNERDFPESGLLCDIKTIKIGIKQLKTDERWYIKLYIHGKHLIDCLVKKDFDSGLELIRDILQFSWDSMQSNLPWNSMALDYLRELVKNDINAYDELHSFLNWFQYSNWKILYMILDQIEAVILDKVADVAIREKFLEGNLQKNYPGFLDFAGFDNYWIKNNWRIREKVASGLAKIAKCDNDSFAKKAINKLDERKKLETDKRVRKILDNLEIIQNAQQILDSTWDIRREPIEDLKEKFISFAEGLKSLNEEEQKKIDFLILKISEIFSNLDRLEELQKFTMQEICSKIDELKAEQDKKFCVMTKILPELGYLSNIDDFKQCNDYQSRKSEINEIRKLIPDKKSRSTAQFEIEETKNSDRSRSIVSSQIRDSYPGKINLREVIQIGIVGKEGAGKSELAIEFANEYQEDFGVIWWIDATKRSTIKASYMKMAEKMGIVSPSLYEKDIIYQLLLALERQKKPWLLVFDNAENSELISEYTPKSRGVALITSRKNSKWEKVYMLQLYNRQPYSECVENQEEDFPNLVQFDSDSTYSPTAVRSPSLSNAIKIPDRKFEENLVQIKPYKHSYRNEIKEEINSYSQLRKSIDKI